MRHVAVEVQLRELIVGPRFAGVFTLARLHEGVADELLTFCSSGVAFIVIDRVNVYRRREFSGKNCNRDVARPLLYFILLKNIEFREYFYSYWTMNIFQILICKLHN